VELSLRGERLVLTGLGHRITAYTNRDKPRFFTADGEEDLGRARFSRKGVEAALHSSIERWGFVEAGMRLGEVATSSRGLDLVETSDQVGSLFGQVTMDTLDDLAWPEHGGRLSLLGEWSLSDLGADREYWRVDVDGRAGRPLGGRLVAEVHGRLGLSGNDLAIYDWYRVGGVDLVPGYHHEELKGAQTFAAALSLRYRLFGQLRALGARRRRQRVRPRRRHDPRGHALGPRSGPLPSEPHRSGVLGDGMARRRRHAHELDHRVELSVCAE
jgi:hypothetical protein